MVTGMQGDRARSALVSTRFGDVRWVPETGSTNADLLELARSGGSDGIVLVADHQRAGRGRLDRSWEAPPGSSLLVSVLVRPGGVSAGLTPADAHLLNSALGVAAADACAEVAGVDARLKWPNDVVAVGPGGEVAGKLGGVLAESVVVGDRLDAVVAGIGLNVNWSEAPPAGAGGAGMALSQLAGHEVDREDLLIAMLRHLDRWALALASADGRSELAERYRARCATVGEHVRVELAGRSFEGRALDVTDDGLLQVAVEGEVRAVAVGDVVHLRHQP